jgi:hypothetical protein
VVAAVVPWNSQLFLVAVKIGPALAAGNTVVLKASEHASAAMLEFGRLVEEAGFPPGVVNIVTGHGEPCGRALTAHPLVARAQARLVWTGAWNTVLVSALLAADRALDDPLPLPDTDTAADLLWSTIEDFHLDEGLPLPMQGTPTPRRLLRLMIERRRMIGSEVFLEDAKPAPITVTLSIRARPGYFRSEMRQALADVFSADEGGFFEPGRLDFGEDLFASDIIEAAMAADGVAVACLNRFKRVGSGWPDRVAEGFIPIADDEYVRCLNIRNEPEKGYFRIVVNGGESG